jgi:hypothetical protein
VKLGGEKEASSFTMSPHMVELCPHGTDIHEILYRRFLSKSVKKIHVWLKSDKNNRHFNP